MLKLPHDRPIAIYNCEKQEIVGLFKTKSLAARYIYNLYNSSSVSNVSNSARHKSKILNADLGFIVTVRYCNEQQITQLGQEDYVILNNYKEARENKMNGFTPAKNWNEIVKRRWAEYKSNLIK